MVFAVADPGLSTVVDVPAHGELRRMRRVERWMGIIVPRLARRVVNGKPPQPGWLPRRWLTVVWGDVDLEAGICAVWLTWRPGSAEAETRTALIERCGGHWQYTGGGSSTAASDDAGADRPAAGQSGQIGMIDCGGAAGGVSYAYRLRHPHSISAAPWVGASQLRVAAEVSHLLVGDRRIQVPGNGRLIVAWKSRSTGSGGLRPLIVAVGHDGSELSRIGPHDSLDSYTWANLNSQQELKLQATASPSCGPVRRGAALPPGNSASHTEHRQPPTTRNSPTPHAPRSLTIYR